MLEHLCKQGWGSEIFSPGSGSAEKKSDPNPLFEMKKNHILGIKFDFINHHFKLDSGLNLVQEKNNFTYPLLQVGSGCQKLSDPHPSLPVACEFLKNSRQNLSRVI